MRRRASASAASACCWPAAGSAAAAGATSSPGAVRWAAADGSVAPPAALPVASLPLLGELGADDCAEPGPVAGVEAPELEPAPAAAAAASAAAARRSAASRDHAATRAAPSAAARALRSCAMVCRSRCRGIGVTPGTTLAKGVVTASWNGPKTHFASKLSFYTDHTAGTHCACTAPHLCGVDSAAAAERPGADAHLVLLSGGDGGRQRGATHQREARQPCPRGTSRRRRGLPPVPQRHRCITGAWRRRKCSSRNTMENIFRTLLQRRKFSKYALP